MLSVRSIKKSFPAGVALDGLTFDVPEGDVFAFIGPNGSGKTTTMRAIVGLTALDSGEITVNGKPVSEIPRNQIGYMPEERGLYPKMTVSDQLVYLGCLAGMSERQAKSVSDSWLVRFSLSQRAHSTVETLSLGNQQRVQIIAALMHEPTLIVLDEPFSGLDPIASELVKQILSDKAKQGCHVIFSSHQLDLVGEICDSMAIVANGKTVASGTIGELTQTVTPVYGIKMTGYRTGDWSTNISGVRVLSVDGALVRLELISISESELIKTLMELGRIEYFALQRRKLSELFITALGKGD